MGILGTITAKSSSQSLITTVDASFTTVRGWGTSQGATSFFGLAGGAAYQMMRAFFLFDTTSIPAGAVINSVTFIQPGPVSNFTNNSTAFVCVTTHTATDPVGTALNNTNYGSVTLNGDTSFGSLNMNVLGTAVGNIGIPLSQAGVNNLIIGGTTRYALRTDLDINNSDPGTNTNQYVSTITNFQIVVDYSTSAFMTTHSKFWGGA